MKGTNVQAWTEEVADCEYGHYVAVCDDDNEPIRNSKYVCDDADGAERFALALGNRLGLEVITDDLMR